MKYKIMKSFEMIYEGDVINLHFLLNYSFNTSEGLQADGKKKSMTM